MVNSSPSFGQPFRQIGDLCWDFALDYAQVLPLLTLYHVVPLVFAEHALMFMMLLNVAIFICSFEGNYLYFFTGEMQI